MPSNNSINFDNFSGLTYSFLIHPWGVSFDFAQDRRAHPRGDRIRMRQSNFCHPELAKDLCLADHQIQDATPPQADQHDKQAN